MFDGRNLVKDGRVVLVTVNYRLGALGFLDFASFGEFDSNLGLRDQIAAYVYRFDHASPLFRLTRIGATHGTEVPYVFGNFGVIPKDPTYKLGGKRAAER